MDRYKMMTTVPVPKLIVRLSTPTIISMLVTGIYNTADTFFVGRISTQATAAVGLVFSVMAIEQALGFFCGHGSGNFIARKLGSKELDKANEMASTGFALAICIGFVVMILGLLYCEQIAYALGATPTTIRDTIDYMRIILLGAPIMCGQLVINNQLRFQGSAFYAMIGLMLGAMINILLDPILILCFKLGVKGAAIATIAGQFISFTTLFLGSRRGENIRLHIKNVHLNLFYIKQIINGGSPSLLRQGLASISTVLLNHAAGDLGGDAGIAAMSVVMRVTMLVMCAVIGFGQGYQPVCSFNYGAGLYERVKEGFFFCSKYGTIFLVFGASLCFIFAPQIVSVFRDDPEVIAIGGRVLRYQSLALPLLAVISIANMMLQSMGLGLKASICASARNGLFFLPLIIILPRVLGMTGVEITQPVADVFSFVLSVPLAYSEIKKMDREAKIQ